MFDCNEQIKRLDPTLPKTLPSDGIVRGYREMGESRWNWAEGNLLVHYLHVFCWESSNIQEQLEEEGGWLRGPRACSTSTTVFA